MKFEQRQTLLAADMTDQASDAYGWICVALDHEGNDILGTQYLCDSRNDLVKELYPPKQNIPRILECVYLAQDVCGIVDHRIQGRDGGRDGTD